MPRYNNQKKTLKYTLEYKLKAVKMSLRNDVQVQHVAESLGIHPFMLSRWRKEYREGQYRQRGVLLVSCKKAKSKPAKKPLTELQKLQKRVAQLVEENDLLKKCNNFLRRNKRTIQVHPLKQESWCCEAL